MDTPSSNNCPSCGTTLDQESDSLADGLCPRCLLEKSLQSTISGHPGSSSPPPVDEVSSAFPDLEIIELIGKGGMGAVYKARQKSLDRPVALKLLPLSLASEPEFAKRFEAEAKALATLNHPNIVTVHEFGQQGDFYFLLMEYVDGPNLRHLLLDHRLSPQEALTIVPPLCDALEFAHKRNIVHCDIKPENLLLSKDGRVKVADFGVAKILGQTTPDFDSEKAAGTPAYMAPEQIDSPHAIDTRADIYSLGVVFYEMLTGERPGKDLTPPSGKNRSVDVRLDEIVLRALEANPKSRWQSANALNTELQTILTERLGEPKVTPPEDLPNSTPMRAWISCAIALVAVLIMAGGFVAKKRIVPIPEAEHDAAIERYFEYKIHLADLRHQFDALDRKPQLTPEERETKEELWDQVSEGFNHLELFGALRGVDDPLIRGDEFGVILILCGVLGMIALWIGGRHLSWLRGQEEPLPGLRPGLVGILLVPIVLAGGFILKAVFRFESLIPNALALAGILLFVLWIGRRVIARTRNLRNAPAFSIVHFIATALVGLAIAIPLTSAQESHSSDYRKHLRETIELEGSHQEFIIYLSPSELSQPEKMEKARQGCEDYAHMKQSLHLHDAELIELKMPKGSELAISLIGSLLAFAAAFILLRKFRPRRA